MITCFADWSTLYSTTCDYFPFADNSFIRVEDKPPDDLPAAFFADTEQGYRAVTENVPKNFAAAFKDPVWGEPARKELNTLISTTAIKPGRGWQVWVKPQTLLQHLTRTSLSQTFHFQRLSRGRAAWGLRRGVCRVRLRWIGDEF